MTFFGYTKNDLINQKALNKCLDTDMYFVITGNSLAIRVDVPIIDFKQCFKQFEHEILLAFNAIDRLNELLERLIREKTISLK